MWCLTLPPTACCHEPHTHTQGPAHHPPTFHCADATPCSLLEENLRLTYNGDCEALGCLQQLDKEIARAVAGFMEAISSAGEAAWAAAKSAAAEAMLDGSLEDHDRLAEGEDGTGLREQSPAAEGGR